VLFEVPDRLIPGVPAVPVEPVASSFLKPAALGEPCILPVCFSWPDAPGLLSVAQAAVPIKSRPAATAGMSFLMAFSFVSSSHLSRAALT
jgi:hypothetical protein